MNNTNNNAATIGTRVYGIQEQTGNIFFGVVIDRPATIARHAGKVAIACEFNECVCYFLPENIRTTNWDGSPIQQ